MAKFIKLSKPLLVDGAELIINLDLVTHVERGHHGCTFIWFGPPDDGKPLEVREDYESVLKLIEATDA